MAARTRWRTTLLAILVTIAITVTGVGALWFVSSMSAHPDPAAVPSTAGVHVGQYSDAIAEGRRIARDMAFEGNLPGVSVAVGVGDDIVWTEGVGWADLDGRVPVTPDTRFRIGSASKVLTSAAVGLLVEQGRLHLDEEVQAYVPEFPKKPWPVTLRQMMGHVAGIDADTGDAGLESPLVRQRCERPVEALPAFADRELRFEPGTRYRYSSYGWIVVSAAVEAAAEQPFLALMQEQVFAPLGMHDTFAESSTEENPEHVGEPAEDFPLFTLIRKVIVEPLTKDDTRAAAGQPAQATFYFPRMEADPRYGMHLLRPHNLSCFAGAMAFFSTPSDLVRFGLAMNNGTLLQPATVQQLQTPQRLTSGEEIGYGLGWDLETVTLAGEQTQMAGHDGETLGGKVASLVTSRERGIAVAVISNISHADTSSLALKVAEAFAARQAR